MPLFNPQSAAAVLNVQKDGALVGSRGTINLQDSGGVTLSVVDNPASTRIDATISSTAGAVSEAGEVPVGTLSTFGEGSQVADCVYFLGTAFTGDNVVVGANVAYHIPVNVSSPITAYQMAVWNGTVVNGSFDVGIYDDTGTKVVSSGAQAQTGTSVIQVAEITDTPLAAGTYYLSLSTNSAGTARFKGASIDGRVAQRAGAFAQDTAYTLPASMTFTAAGGSFFVPVIMVNFEASSF